MESTTNGSETGPIFDVNKRSTWPEIPSGVGAVHELTSMDLSMKLHYIRAVYFFKAESVAGFSKHEHFSDPWSALLNIFYMAAGRIRLAPDTGRPFVKCNDAGVRYFEARCSMTLEEWLVEKNWNDGRLVRWEPIGPQLSFSPLVYLQITRFECGGVALGLSWAHVLGDPSSVISLMKLYGEFLSGRRHQLFLTPVNAATNSERPAIHNHTNPISLKRVSHTEPATETDHWVIHNSLRIETHVFLITPTQMDQIRITANTHHRKTTHNPNPNKLFQLVSALIWKALAKIWRNRETNRNKNTSVVTIICCGGRGITMPGNQQRIYSLAGSEDESVWELADRIAATGTEDESEAVEKQSGDVVAYGGGGLTFVNLEEEDVYGMEIRGQKAAMVSYGVEMVGDHGVVMVLPGPEIGGRMVNMSLPACELAELQNELMRDWGI